MDELERLSRELVALRGAHEALERRVSRVEAWNGREVPLAPDPIAPPAQLAVATREAADGSQVFFNRLALASFALGAALVLRTATRQDWWSAELGTAVGLAYASGLVVLPLWLDRARGGWPAARMLAICGGLLAPLIVLETVHRSRVLGIPAAAAVLLAFVVLGGAGAIAHGAAGVLLSILLAQMGAAAALGFVPDGLALRLAVVVAAVVLVHVAAARRGWPKLRPLVLVPAGLLVGVTVLVTAQRPTLPPGTALAAALAASAVWLAIAANAAVRASQLTAFESGALVVATLWCHGLLALWSPRVAMPAAAVVTLLALAGAALAARDEARLRARNAFVLTAGLLAVASLPWLDRTGVLLGAAALGLGLLSRRVDASSGRLAAAGLAALALVVAARKGGLLETATIDATTVAAGAALGAVLLVHALGATRRAPEAWLAPATLALAMAALLATFRLIAHRVLPGGSAALAVTLALALSSLGVLYAGRRLGDRPATWTGLLGLGALGAKVLLWDVMHLDGLLVISAVLTLGLAATAASLILRHFAQAPGLRRAGSRAEAGHRDAA